ncbi:hypothetical protein [Peribacillus frigoritolerans]|uniref:hypothetical protein n=1 Tax=Peribacillus frigoritolerans TaxID=450367 RepID=UPI002E1E086C|nr:hypothetical protein [Peribacillus frigoritolerans]
MIKIKKRIQGCRSFVDTTYYCKKHDHCHCHCRYENRPTYSELRQIPVPVPEGITNLPAFIYFDVDNRFTAAQRQRIREAIEGVLLNWFNHYNQKWNGGTNDGVSELAACTNTYAINNLQPVWYQGQPILNGQVATNVAMDQFTQLIRDNGFRISPPAKIDYFIPTPITSSTIRGETAFRKTGVPLSFVINPTQLDRVDVSSLVLTGSMFHAWLHRAGYSHPEGEYTSYFIGEAPMCVMRGFQPKVPAQPDSTFFQFFD